MIKNDDFVVRVAVGSLLGPQSAVFRIWSPLGKSDVYASVRGIAGEIKISLHETGECNVGLTTQFAKQETAAVDVMGGSRHQSRWTRQKHVGSGMVVPLQFAIPASELRSIDGEPATASKKVTWLEPPEQGRSVIISCAFTGQSLADDEWPGRRNGTHLLGIKLLPNSEKFWLFWQNCPTSPIEQMIFSEAEAHMKRQKMVRFSGITDDTPPAPRRLLFREFAEDQLLVVLDAGR
ncbi:MAG: hypothetical protein Q7J31_17660 [Syntrophales bacterium]|nr:hypothetical protein [Syntrophales bacterium]